MPLSGDETARQVEVSQRKMRDLDKQLRSLFEALAADWKPADKDREAAWEIHVELRTRISTQRLHYLDGDEGAALDSLVKLFQVVRDVCRKHGSAAVVTLAVADLMLNHSLRELTASWHVRKLQGKLNPEHLKRQFRVELTRVQEQLRIISAVLHILATGREEIPLKPGQPELPVFGEGWKYNQVLGLLPSIGDQIREVEATEIRARRATMSAVTGKQPVTSEDPGTLGLVGLAISGGRLFAVDTVAKNLVACDLSGGAAEVIVRDLPVGAPTGIVGRHAGGVGDMCGPMWCFTGIAAGPDGTIFIAGDAEGSVLALQQI